MSSVALLCMLPEDFSSEVMDWGKENIDGERLCGVPNKGRERSPHITLATGIVDEQPEQAIDILSSHGPFEVELGPINKFRKLDKGYDVIKVDVISPILNEINSKILQSLQVNDPIKPYSPHVTIAYVAPGSCDELLGSDMFAGRKIPIEAIVYSDRSRGGRMIHLNKRKPLKDSLDYGSEKEEYTLEEVSAYMTQNNINIKSISAVDIGRVVIALRRNAMKR